MGRQRVSWLRAELRASAALGAAVLVLTGLAVPAGAAGAPTLSVTPSTGLRDLQQVQIVASGYTPGSPVLVTQCQSGPATKKSCDDSTLRFLSPDASGTIRDSVTVRRLLTLGKKSFDCATAGECVLRAEDFISPATADAPLGFDPNVPPTVAMLKVTPAGALADHQLVRIDGSGFTPGASALVLECSKKARRNSGACSYASNRSAVVGDDGKFVVKRFAVARMLPQYLINTNEPLDCAAKAGNCVVTVETEDVGGPITTAPLTFDPARPPVEPTVTGSPLAKLTDHQLVTLTGRGFTPGAAVRVIQCGTGASIFDSGCDYSNTASVTAGFGGRFKLTLPVQRRISLLTGVTSEAPVDCAASAKACTFQVVDGSAAGPVVIGLNFNGAVGPKAGALTATPSKNLLDNQRITAQGSGFTPFTTVTLAQCSAEVTEGELSACDQASVQHAVVGANGQFTGSIAVHQVIGGYDGLDDCGASAGACVIAAIPGGLYSSGSGIGEFSPIFPFSATSGTGVAPSPARRNALAQPFPGTAFTPISFG
jgi:Neocarzinostatin family